MKFMLLTTCMNRTNALKALITIAICTTRTSCSSCSNRNRDLNKRRVLDPGGGGGLPYETDGDARRLA